MSDYDSSLPMRTENDGDVVAKISDATIPSQQLKVNADGSIDTNTSLPGGTAVEITDGTDTLAVNADGSINAVVSASDLDIRDLTHVTDSIKIGDGVETLAVNADGSINVVVSEDVPGDDVFDHQTSTAVIKNASVNHDYAVTAGKTLVVEQVMVSASGKIRAEVLVDGVVKFVAFNSTSQPNVEIPMKKLLKANALEVVRITILNRDNQPQDVYSTMSGTEV